MWRLTTRQIASKVPWTPAGLGVLEPTLFKTLLGRQGYATEASGATASQVAGAAAAEAPPQGPQHSVSSDPQPDKDPREKIIEYHRFTDIYLGGLWNKLEAELRQNEGIDFDYDVQLTSGCMRLKLPDDAEVVICKEPSEEALKIESNLHDIYGGGDPRDEAHFKLNDEGEFVDGGLALHEYLEDHLAKHLKVQFDLDPEPGPHDKVYGPDPT